MTRILRFLRRITAFEILLQLISRFNQLNLNLSSASSLRMKYSRMRNSLRFLKSIYYTSAFPKRVRQALQLKFPRCLLIETVSFCNAQCVICPQHDINKELPQGVMSWDLYKKIIDESQLYQGLRKICLYRLNEPLIDKDLLIRIKYTKKVLPHVKLQLSTNGSLLNPELSKELLNYIDIFWFSAFGIKEEDYREKQPGLDFKNTIANIDFFFMLKRKLKVRNYAVVRIPVTNSQLIEPRQVFELRKTIEFWKKKGIECIFSSFSNRASNAPYSKVDSGYFKNNKLRGCWMYNAPLTEMNIIFNGDVLLCCEDCRREVILGNLTEHSLYEIWNSRLYDNIRDKIYVDTKGENTENFLCTRCPNPYLKIY